MRPALESCHCVVLPSFYREGTPRSLLEAAAAGRPIITTDMPGCRNAVRDGETGFLCQPKDVKSLAQALTAFLELSEDQRVAMGRKARALAQSAFDEQIVISAYRDLLVSSSSQR